MSAPRRLQRERHRAALRAAKLQLRQRLRAQVEAQRHNPLFVAALERRQKRRRRRRLVAALVAALLLLLIARCECDEPPLAPAPVEVAEPELAPAPVRLPPKKRPKGKRPLEGKLEASGRSGLEVDATAPPPWLGQFRLQVAARSPRLAACFIGADRPGALRWTALVHAKSGRVTESVLEPMFRGGQLDEAQHDCLVNALVEQPFKLDASAEEAAARRLSLIFEF
jgi:hypothetical protein